MAESRKQKDGVVRRVKPDPRVWKVAKQLAKGDTKRLTVVSTTEVIVKNP